MRLLLAIGVATMTLTVSLLAGQSDLSKLKMPTRPVFLQAQGVTLQQAVEALGTNAGIEIRWSPEIDLADRPPVNAQFNNVTFKDAFTTLMRSAELDYIALDEKTILIRPNP